MLHLMFLATDNYVASPKWDAVHVAISHVFAIGFLRFEMFCRHNLLPRKRYISSGDKSEYRAGLCLNAQHISIGYSRRRTGV